MKNAWRAQAVGVILAAFIIAGCSSTQPDRIDTRSMSLSFLTTATVPLWNCYESPFPYCFPVLEGPPDNPIQTVAARSVPWRYSVMITIIRAGTFNEVVATSVNGVLGSSLEPGDAVPDFVSLSDYDPDQPPAPDHSEPGIGDFTNGKMVSSGSPIYLSWVFVDPGLPNLLDIYSPVAFQPATFDFDLNTGDTVIVRARKQSVDASPSVSPPYEDVKLTATLTLGGSAVAVEGPQISSINDKTGFTFSFTVR
jgi:hypothetical protein